jgi:hypothetical protein
MMVRRRDVSRFSPIFFNYNFSVLFFLGVLFRFWTQVYIYIYILHKINDPFFLKRTMDYLMAFDVYLAVALVISSSMIMKPFETFPRYFFLL